MSCCICLDSFNKSTRCPSKCPYCSIQVCRTCLQTYLLGDVSDIPKCVNPECGHGYNREFLDGELTQTFRLKIYKAHREKVLSDRERSRFPSTQEDVHAYKVAKKRADEIKQEMQALETSIAALYTDSVKRAQSDIRNYSYKQFAIRLQRPIPPQYQIEDSTFYAAQKTLTNYTKELRPFQKQLRPLRREWTRLRPIVHTYGRFRAATNAVNTIVPERQEFIKACPSNNCKGFLSSAWKCGLCDLWSCPSCHEIKGDSRDAEHACDPDKVLTVQMIQKEAKSCPKCGVQICKIEGCDQMWCTSCNTGFNWRTGKIANGPIHNPHYFEWLRTQGIAPVPAQLHAGNCDYVTDRAVTNALLGHPSDADRYLLRAWQLMRERQDRQQYGGADMEEKHRVLRVRCMANEITEEEWKRTLQRYEKDAHFQLANNQIRDLFVGASRDLIRQVLEPGKDRAAVQAQVEELLAYCNTSANAVSKRFARRAHTYVLRTS